MTTATLTPAPRSARYSPAVAWWVYVADFAAKTVVLYRCETEAQAIALRDREIDNPTPEWPGRIMWRVNEWNARRHMRARGWTAVAVQDAPEDVS